MTDLFDIIGPIFTMLVHFLDAAFQQSRTHGWILVGILNKAILAKRAEILHNRRFFLPAYNECVGACHMYVCVSVSVCVSVVRVHAYC
jgi:hypothetical protein